MSIIESNLLERHHDIPAEGVQCRFACVPPNDAYNLVAPMSNLCSQPAEYCAPTAYVQSCPGSLRCSSTTNSINGGVARHARTNSLKGFGCGYSTLYFWHIKFEEMRADSKMVGSPLPG